MKPGDRFTKNGVTVEVWISPEVLLLNKFVCQSCCFSRYKTNIEASCTELNSIFFPNSTECPLQGFVLSFKLIEGDLKRLLE